MKKLAILTSIVIILFTANSCTDFNPVNITSCSISSISAEGLRSLKTSLNLGIDSPYFGFTISSIEGNINNQGKELATIQTGSFSVDRSINNIYPVECLGSISKEVGLMDLLKLAASKDFSGMTVNMNMKIKLKCGLGTTLRFKDIKVTDLMDRNTASTYFQSIIETLS